MEGASRGMTPRRSKGFAMTKDYEEAAIARAIRAREGTPYLSPAQAAYYLGVAERTLQEYRTAGTGPRYRRHSRHLRYHIDDLDAWSQQRGKAGDDA